MNDVVARWGERAPALTEPGLCEGKLSPSVACAANQRYWNIGARLFPVVGSDIVRDAGDHNFFDVDPSREPREISGNGKKTRMIVARMTDITSMFSFVSLAWGDSRAVSSRCFRLLSEDKDDFLFGGQLPAAGDVHRVVPAHVSRDWCIEGELGRFRPLDHLRVPYHRKCPSHRGRIADPRWWSVSRRS